MTSWKIDNSGFKLIFLTTLINAVVGTYTAQMTPERHQTWCIATPRAQVAKKAIAGSDRI